MLMNVHNCLFMYCSMFVRWIQHTFPNIYIIVRMLWGFIFAYLCVVRCSSNGFITHFQISVTLQMLMMVHTWNISKFSNIVWSEECAYFETSDGDVQISVTLNRHNLYYYLAATTENSSSCGAHDHHHYINKR